MDTIVLAARPGVIRTAAHVVRDPVDPVEYRLPALLTPGLVVRRPALADAAALHALVTACDLAATGSSGATLAQTARVEG